MVSGPVNPGDILAGKYRVERVLGAGGMGVVVAATHLDLLEPRALKFILPGALADADAAPRFLREARASAKVKSEHVAKVFDTGRLENGAPYMVMEYLEGSPLDALIKAHGSLSVPVAPKAESPNKPAPAPPKDVSPQKAKSAPADKAPAPKKTILNGEPIF